MQTVIDRVMHTYGLMANRSGSVMDEAREKLTTYIDMLSQAGENDPHRLTVCGLAYLRELEGRNDPVKAGFTGL